MPAWAGRWKGGRYYENEDGKKVFFIERRVAGRVTPIKLKTHDEELAVGELARFVQDPVSYLHALTVQPEPFTGAIHITADRINRYLDSKGLRKAVRDHRAARRSYLLQWSQKKFDLSKVTEEQLLLALHSFKGGHRGRTEALNAFARFLVKKGDLAHWRPIENDRDPMGRLTKKGTRVGRAERVAYSVEELQEKYQSLTNQRFKDAFLLRAETGLHFTEIRQLQGCPVQTGPLPDQGVAIRKLASGHEIVGVLQVRHKTKPRHRVSVRAVALEAALRLREGMPSRDKLWRALKPLVPSNLRHTWVTLAGEVGEQVTYKSAGVPLDVVQSIIGHRVGTTVTQGHYDKQQVPTMVRLPFKWS